MKCFLTGAPTQSLARLRDWLEGEGVDIRVPFTTFPEPGETGTRALMRVIGACDFVVAALSNDGPAAVMFELGIALSFGKPVVIISEAPETLPLDVRDLVCIRAPLDDEKVVRFQISLFLRDIAAPPVTPPPRQKSVSVSSLAMPLLQQRLLDVYAAHGENRARQAEDLVDHALSAARFTFQRNFLVRAQGRVYKPDFGVWMDDLKSLSGPVIIEVKASSNEDSLFSGWSRLIKYMTATHAGAGILVYLGDEPIPNRFRWTSDLHPVLLVLELREFVKCLLDGSISRMIVEERNLRFHSRRTE